MEKHDYIARQNPYENEGAEIAEEVLESMWQLFQAIGRFWGNTPDQPESSLKSQLVTFMQNRIKLDDTYQSYYLNAMEVIDALAAQHGRNKAYEFLFTNPGASLAPPSNPVAFARQKVSNEFITLQLALGGFKAFGGAINYMGYFGGANIKGHTPYRTYDDK